MGKLTKNEMISEIFNILLVTESFDVNCLDVEQDGIVYKETRSNIHLIEYFSPDYAKIMVYDTQTDNQIDEYDVNYQQLPKKLIEEIYEVVKEWEIQMSE